MHVIDDAKIIYFLIQKNIFLIQLVFIVFLHSVYRKNHEALCLGLLLII